MARVRVHAFSISLDGYGAGPDQSPETPLGVGGEELHEWMIPTRTFQQIVGGEGGTTGVEGELTRRGFENVGAWIMGRNFARSLQAAGDRPILASVTPAAGDRWVSEQRARRLAEEGIASRQAAVKTWSRRGRAPSCGKDAI